MKKTALLLAAVLLFGSALSCGPTRQEIRQGIAEDYQRAHPDMDPRTREAIRQGTIFIGMEWEAVVSSIGVPEKMNKTVTAGLLHMQWVYGHHKFVGRHSYFVATKYLYFDNGILTGWQD